LGQTAETPEKWGAEVENVDEAKYLADADDSSGVERVSTRSSCCSLISWWLHRVFRCCGSEWRATRHFFVLLGDFSELPLESLLRYLLSDDWD
jgi:hypothetical protein